MAIGYLQLLSAILPAFSQSFLMSFATLYPNASFVFNALNEDDEVVDLHPDTPFPAINGQAPTIEFDQMSFDYPPRPNERTRKVGFAHLSCKIESGERVTIVTESGVGKSTLFNLLFGYYLPTTGTIKVNGQDITQMSLQALQRNITIFAQTPDLLNGSIRENICYGAENPNDVTDDVIWQLARDTNLEAFLKKFDQNLEACDLIKLKDNNILVVPKGIDDLLQADFSVIYVKNELVTVERQINNNQLIAEVKEPVARTQE